MKFRTYNKTNISNGHIFATYFRTKKEALDYAEKIGGNAIVEKKIGSSWFEC